jgi:type II secretory ATPase GspE/PulE/Tfp pilus assembly ATPase PilB-like protein
MSAKPVLTIEEITLIQQRYLPEIFGEYRDVVELVNRIVKRAAEIDGSDIYLSEEDQRRILVKIGTSVLELEGSVKDLKLYLRNIAIRLGML